MHIQENCRWKSPLAKILRFTSSDGFIRRQQTATQRSRRNRGKAGRFNSEQEGTKLYILCLNIFKKNLNDDQCSAVNYIEVLNPVCKKCILTNRTQKRRKDHNYLAACRKASLTCKVVNYLLFQSSYLITFNVSQLMKKKKNHSFCFPFSISQI